MMTSYYTQNTTKKMELLSRCASRPALSSKPRKQGEEGAALLIAILLLGFIMILSLGASKFGVAAMRGQEQTENTQHEYWQARSAASSAQAFLISTIPAQYTTDLRAAKNMASGTPLPAFDSATVLEGHSQPVAIISNGNLQRSGFPLNTCTSLLGNTTTWAGQRAPLAQDYAVSRGFSAEAVRVADFYEVSRRNFQAGEPAYVLRYIVDAKAGTNRVRPSGDVLLGPATRDCETTIELRVQPSSIIRGNSTTLTVLYSHATRVVVTASDSRTLLDQAVTDQSTIQTLTLTDKPNSSITYQAQAFGAAGCSAITPQVSVTVTAPPCPSIGTFTATPTAIVPGGSSTLAWSVTNSGRITLENLTAGTSEDLGSPSGTRVVMPVVTTTYRLTAYATDGSCPQTAMVTVTVNPCPVIASFTGNPLTITNGGSSVLSWNVINAAGATITLDGAPVAASGSRTVTPAVTTTYTLRVSGPSGCSPQQATVTIVVNQPLCPTIASFIATPSAITIGGSSTISWNVTNSGAATIRLTGPGVDQVVGPTGSLVVTLNAAGVYTFTLTVTANTPGCSNQSANLDITVTPVPVTPTPTPTPAPTPAVCATINSFNAAPSCSFPGQPVTLSWDISNAGTVTINGSGNYPGTGSVTVNPAVTTTYTLTTSAPGCPPLSQQRTVTVDAPPTINFFNAQPISIFPGQSSQLSWGITGAGSATINGIPVNASGGTLLVAPAVTTDYVLTASSNGCNGATKTQSVRVTVMGCAPPTVQFFTATPSSVTQGAGGFIRLQWAVSDSTGTGVSVSIAPNVGGGLPSSGFVDISAPNTTTTYTLTATNGCGGSITAQAVVTVNAGPLCAGAPGSNDFQIGIGLQDRSSTVAIGNSFQPNEPLILVWTTRNANPSTVRINGNPVTPSGEMEVTQGADGNYSWTITAENLDGSRTLSRSVTTSILTTQGMILCPVVPDFFTNTPTVNVGSSFTYFWDRKNYGNINSACWTDSPPTAGSGTAQGQTGSLTITPDWYSPICVPDTIGLKKYGATAYNTGNPDVCIRDNWFVLRTLPPAGCGRIYSFHAGPQIVAQPGVPIQLNWSIDPGATVTINNGVGNVSNASSVTLVAPAADTVYTITATWPGGCQQQKSTRVIVHQKGWVLSSSSAGAISTVFVEGDMTNNPDGSVTVTIQAVGLGLGGEFQSPSARLQLFGPDGSAFYDQTIVNWQLVPGLGQGITYTVTVPASAIPLSPNPACQPPIDMRIDALTPFVLFFSTTLHHTSLDTREPDGFPVQDESIPDASYAHQMVRAKP